MDLLKLAAQLLTDHFKGDVANSHAESAVSGLFGDGQGGINIADIVSKMVSSGSLSGIVDSWLGDGANEGIQKGQLQELFGNDKLSTFSQALGQAPEKAAEGLGSILSQLIDTNSSGGSLLSNIGGLQGALDIGKKFF
jgi:uncharacterized protein YidB (DUF937 family)